MPTDRNKVSAYLSDQDFALLGELAAQHRVSKSQMVAIAIRYMSRESTPTNTVTTPPDNPTVESEVTASTIGSLVESKLVELLSNPTIEVRSKLLELMELLSHSTPTNNGTLRASDSSEVTGNGNTFTVEVLGDSKVTNNASKVTTETLRDNDATGNSSKVIDQKNNPSEDALEDASNENQDTNIIEEDKPVVEAKSEDVPESEETKTAETTSQSGDEGLTDKELAEWLVKQGRKVTPPTVNRWRNKKSNPTGKNKKIFKEWEVKGDRWIRL